MEAAAADREREIAALQADLGSVRSELEHWRTTAARYEEEIGRLQGAFSQQQQSATCQLQSEPKAPPVGCWRAETERLLCPSAECSLLQQRCSSLQQECDGLRAERTTLADELRRLEAELSRCKHHRPNLYPLTEELAFSCSLAR